MRRTNLENMHILISRPQKHASELLFAIKWLNGSATCIPLFAIASNLDPDLLSVIQAQLAQCDLAICVSRNAAELLLSALPPTPQISWAAVGPATAEYMQQQGVKKIIYPLHPPYDSESLIASLKNQSFEFQDKHIIIFSGEGGRELLAEELRALQANIETIEVYRRTTPDIDSSELLHVLFAAPCVDIIIITCVTSLINLRDLAGDRWAEIINIPLLVVSERIHNFAVGIGFKVVHVAHNMSDIAILNALSSINTQANV